MTARKEVARRLWNAYHIRSDGAKGRGERRGKGEVEEEGEVRILAEAAGAGWPAWPFAGGGRISTRPRRTGKTTICMPALWIGSTRHISIGY